MVQISKSSLFPILLVNYFIVLDEFCTDITPFQRLLYERGGKSILVTKSCSQLMRDTGVESRLCQMFSPLEHAFCSGHVLQEDLCPVWPTASLLPFQSWSALCNLAFLLWNICWNWSLSSTTACDRHSYMCFVEVVCCEEETCSVQVHHCLILTSHFLSLKSVSFFLVKRSNPPPEVSCFLHDLWLFNPTFSVSWVHVCVWICLVSIRYSSMEFCCACFCKLIFADVPHTWCFAYLLN